MSPPGALPRPVRGGARLRPFNAEALPGLNPPKGDACARRNRQPRRKRGSGQGWRRSLPGRGRIHHGQFVRPHTNLQAAVEAAVDCCPPCACESRKSSPAARPSPVRARPYPPGRRALHDQAARRLVLALTAFAGRIAAGTGTAKDRRLRARPAATGQAAHGRGRPLAHRGEDDPNDATAPLLLPGRQGECAAQGRVLHFCSLFCGKFAEAEALRRGRRAPRCRRQDRSRPDRAPPPARA